MSKGPGRRRRVRNFGASRAALLFTWLFMACGGRSVTHDDAGPLPDAANGGRDTRGGSSAGNAHAGRTQSYGGGAASGGTPTVVGAGETNGSAGLPGSAGEMSGSAGEPPLANSGGAGAGGQPDASGGAGGAGATCESIGNVYPLGKRWAEGCRICSCSGGGVVSCNDSACRAACLHIARNFAVLRSEAARCDIADPDACTQFVGPASLHCDCPVPYSVNSSAAARELRDNYARYACGKPHPECDCPAWETASCVEGLCQGA